MGDGFILQTDRDGNELWSGFYFNGTGPDEITEHRVKGMAVSGGTLHLLTQAYTGTANGDRYWGYWYDGTGSLGAMTVSTAELSAEAASTPDGGAFDASGHRSGWSALPDAVEWQPAADKSDGTPPDADVMLSTITL